MNDFLTSLSNVKKLRKLVLDFNTIKISSNERPEFFVSCENLFKNLKKLETLFFVLNRMGTLADESITNIVNGIAPLQEVKTLHLDLSHNAMNGKQITSFVDVLENKKNLKEVNINLFSEEFAAIKKFLHAKIFSKPWARFIGPALSATITLVLFTMIVSATWPAIVTLAKSTTIISAETAASASTLSSATGSIINAISPNVANLAADISINNLGLVTGDVVNFCIREQKAIKYVVGGITTGAGIVGSESVRGAFTSGAGYVKAGAALGLTALQFGGDALGNISNVMLNGMGGIVGNLIDKTATLAGSTLSSVLPSFTTALTLIPGGVFAVIAAFLATYFISWYYDISLNDVFNKIKDAYNWTYYKIANHFTTSTDDSGNEFGKPIDSLEKVKFNITLAYIENIKKSVNGGNAEALQGVDASIQQMQTGYSNLYGQYKESLSKLSELIEEIKSIGGYIQRASREDFIKVLKEKNKFYLLENPDSTAQESFDPDYAIELYYNGKLNKAKDTVENRLKLLNNITNQFNNMHSEVQKGFGELMIDMRKELTQLFVKLQNTHKDNPEALKQDVAKVKLTMKELYDSSLKIESHINFLEKKYRQECGKQENADQKVKAKVISDLRGNKQSFVTGSIDDWYDKYKGGSNSIPIIKIKYNYTFFEQMYNDAATMTGSKRLSELGIESIVGKQTGTTEGIAEGQEPVTPRDVSHGEGAKLAATSAVATASSIFFIKKMSGLLSKIDFKAMFKPNLEKTLNDSLAELFVNKVNKVVHNLDAQSLVQFNFNVGNMNNISELGLGKIKNLITGNQDKALINVTIGEFTKIEKGVLQKVIDACPNIIIK